MTNTFIFESFQGISAYTYDRTNAVPTQYAIIKIGTRKVPVGPSAVCLSVRPAGKTDADGRTPTYGRVLFVTVALSIRKIKL